MEILLVIVSIIWILGWIKELAFFHSRLDRHEISYPNDGVKYLVPVMLFFAWPYFYFYGK